LESIVCSATLSKKINMEEFTIEDLHTTKIWEDDKTVFQIEPRGSEYRVIMFSLVEGSLQFVQVAFYRDAEKLLKFVKKMGMHPTNKILSVAGGGKW